MIYPRAEFEASHRLTENFHSNSMQKRYFKLADLLVQREAVPMIVFSKCVPIRLC
jgi:hypothetical protein